MIMKSGQQLCFLANLYYLINQKNKKKKFENDEYKEK